MSFDEAVCNVKGGSKVIVEREEECAKISDSAVACSVPHSNKKVRCKVMKQKSMAEVGGPLSRGVLKSMRKVKRKKSIAVIPKRGVVSQICLQAPALRNSLISSHSQQAGKGSDYSGPCYGNQ